MRKEFYDALDTVAKAQRTQTLLDFVFQWDYTSIESKQSKATNLKSNSAYHQKRKAFVLLSFFMDEKELSVPDDLLLFTTWKAAFVMSAKNSIERTSNIMIENGSIPIEKHSKTSIVKVSHLHAKFKEKLNLLEAAKKKTDIVTESV